jgi:hypothetical protein
MTCSENKECFSHSVVISFLEVVISTGTDCRSKASFIPCLYSRFIHYSTRESHLHNRCFSNIPGGYARNVQPVRCNGALVIKKTPVIRNKVEHKRLFSGLVLTHHATRFN